MSVSPRKITRRALGSKAVERTYADMEGVSLLLHVRKHVLNPEEAWSSVLGVSVPPPPPGHASAAPHESVAALALRIGTSTAVAEVVRIAQRALPADPFALICYAACASELGECAAAPAGTVERFCAELGIYRFFPASASANVVAAQPAFLQKVVFDGRLAIFLRMLELEPAELAALRGVWRTISKRANKSLERELRELNAESSPRTWAEIERWVKEDLGRLRAELRSHLGPDPDGLISRYLDAGAAAAARAAARPRHVDYTRHGIAREGYVDDQGIAVVLMRDAAAAGAHRQVTIFRPTEGKGTLEKALAAVDQVMFLGAGRCDLPDSGHRRFLEGLRVKDDQVQGFNDLDQWMLP